ncbi:MAG: DUF3786 domain-containing protein [Desulfobacterales bacterium]|nr:DUF3786 domain-containing protein [Desulfobacterales bacterium]
MTDNYSIIVEQNLQRRYADLPGDIHTRIGAQSQGDALVFRAFGQTCTFSPGSILLDHAPQTGVLGILISLYALHATTESAVATPFRAFKELPDSMPYAGAFAAHVEQILVPRVGAIEAARSQICTALDGGPVPGDMGGDFGFTVWPLPKIALCYIFYRADEDFPAAATCLYASNARRFLPTDALADVGEYTSRAILSLAAAASA